ncbi:unnamed protein product [Rotaria sp. Silwood1]|nr:unnamed protein product [Rotaria sp. Silwood1]CAF4575663.1 unnamed protein product [Rotaria sp. Silwood1]
MYSPKVAQTEALALASREFVDSILEDRLPLTNGYDGLKIVKILEAAEKSIKERGSSATILCGITIEENAVVGAGSVVTKNVKANSVVAGNPAKEIKKNSSL